MTDFVLTTGSDTFPDGLQDNSGDDVISGLAGMDIIHGGAGNDLINGGTEQDTLFGDDGDDGIDLGLLPLGDVADGGSGVDTVSIHFDGVTNLATDKPVRVVAEFSTGAWSVLVDGITGPTLSNFEALDIDCGDAGDRIVGGAGADTISGAGGNDLLRGGAGADWIAKTWGHYDVQGGTGRDVLAVSLANEKNPGAALIFDALAGTISAGAATHGNFGGFETYVIGGTLKDDIIVLDSGDDQAFGNDSADQITLGSGDDLGDGGLGADVIFGGNGQDTLNAGDVGTGPVQAADQLYGGTGNDQLFVFTPGSGSVLTYSGSVFSGGGGADLLEFAGALATLDLTGATISGIETLSYSTTFSFSVRMTAGQVNGVANYQTGRLEVMTAGALVMTGDLFMTSITLFSGGQSLDLSASTKPFSDFGPAVIGGLGDDVVIGSARRDSFAGAGGADDLQGGAANDTLVGGAGADRLTGGADQDTFTFNFASDSAAGQANRDVITDFQVAAGNGATFVDKLVFSLIDASAAGPGNEAFAFIGTNAFTAEAQLRVTQMTATDTLIELNTTGTGGADMQIVLLNFQASTFTTADFIG